jgi:hypothetical protein
MTDKQLNGLSVAILATDGFEEAELVNPAKFWMLLAQKPP